MLIDIIRTTAIAVAIYAGGMVIIAELVIFSMQAPLWARVASARRWRSPSRPRRPQRAWREE